MDALGGPPENCDANLRTLLKDFQNGVPGAIDQLMHLYGPQLLRVVRARLNRQMRRRFDSADFTQAVWKSFFCQIQKLDFNSEMELEAYLRQMASNKVGLELRQAKSLKRGIKNEIVGESATKLLQQIRSRDPTPSAVLTSFEESQRLLGDKSDLFKQALELRVNGYSHDEIAERLGVTARTIRRIFAILRTESQKCRNS